MDTLITKYAKGKLWCKESLPMNNDGSAPMVYLIINGFVPILYLVINGSVSMVYLDPTKELFREGSVNRLRYVLVKFSTAACNERTFIGWQLQT
ncbi:hypothetical protein CEXT_224531 [Caerostris extrusa]|uniref:Uncharacterized protein n=1 Tax=Caerostris extrusa TaxID=172846 RepID=A0AAV4M4B3_CAEEX|nr:hypothetical protein CEXT_224531 [Caerostris extrusa]